MADEVIKKVIVKVDLDIASYKKELQVANAEVAKLTTSQALLRKEGKQGSEQFAENQLEIKKYSTQVSDLKRVINNATVANADMTGSNVQLKAALSASTYELNKLSEAEVTGTQRGAQLKEQVLNLSDALKSNETAVGNNYRNVGNYSEGLKELKAELKAAKSAAVDAANAFGMDSKEFKAATNNAGELKDKLDDINAATKSAATGSDLGKFKNQLKDVGSSLLELDFKEAAERAKVLSLTVKSFSWAGMIEGGKALAVTMYEVGAAMLALPIVWVAAGIAAIVGAWYLVQKAATDSVDKQVEALQRLTDMENRIYDLKISLAKSAGKEIEQMEVDKLKKSKERIDEQIKDLEKLEKFTTESYDRAGIARQTISNRLTDDQKTKLDELRKLQSKTQDDIYKAEAEVSRKRLELTVKATEKIKEQTEKTKDNTKKILDQIQKDEEAANEKRLADNEKLLRQIEDQKIQMIANDEVRELAKAALENSRALSEISKSLADNKTKHDALEIQQEAYETNVDEIKSKHYKIRQTEFDKAVDDQIKSDKPRVDAATKSEEEIEQAGRDRIDATFDAALASMEAERVAYEKHVEDMKKLNSSLTSSVQTNISSIFEIQNNNRNAEITGIETEAKIKIDALQTQADQGIITQQEFETKSNRIKLDAAAKEAVIKRKQFESGKKLALINIAIKTAQGVMTAFNAATPYEIAAYAAAAIFTGALEAQVVSSQEAPAFADGGKTLSGKRITSSDGRRISRSNGDNLLATVRTNEVILNERQQQALGGANTFRAIGVPGFAGGGSTNDGGLLANRLSSRTDDYIAASNAQRRINRTLPAPIVLVQDIVESVGNNIKVTDKGNL
ncbi:MAG: hypothetical protein V4549_18155 [Bacteroidota bacterium]